MAAKPGRQPTGRLVVLEGIDGAGKTTVAQQVTERLEAASLPVTRTQEPTGSFVGKAVRQALQDPEHDPISEALLFAADHATHTLWIRDRLEAGELVLSDRYSTSWRVYQSITLETSWPSQATLRPREWLDHVLAPFELEPDLVLLLDLPVEDAIARMDTRPGENEKFERARFLEVVRDRYVRLARERGYTIVDASGSLEATVETCATKITDLLQEGSPA